MNSANDKPVPPVMRVPILYEDVDLLTVDKPAGMVVHPAYRHPDGTLFDAMVARQLARGERKPWLLHRLDRDTSGVVLLAKTERARRSLVRQFERRSIRKSYLAVVYGRPATSEGMVCQNLKRDPADRRRVIVSTDGQEAFTRYAVLASAGFQSLVLAEPRTGRTHQIRAHLAWLGHPVLGDEQYRSGSELSGADGTPPAPARQMLHAWCVALSHPVTGEALMVQAPIPTDMESRMPSEWRAICARLAAAPDMLDVIVAQYEQSFTSDQEDSLCI